jgi:hypothetical protein
MKSFVPLTLLAAGLLFAGCASNDSNFSSVPGPSGMTAANTSSAPIQSQSSQQKQTAPAPAQSIVTPDTSVSAKVVAYNSVGRFVVLNFPVGQMASNDQTLSLYRGGLKVGEVKITGPQRDNNTVADLVTGEAQVGDEARNR